MIWSLELIWTQKPYLYLHTEIIDRSYIGLNPYHLIWLDSPENALDDVITNNPASGPIVPFTAVEIAMMHQRKRLQNRKKTPIRALSIAASDGSIGH